MAILYLHIGIPKTGTTALQNLLAKNPEVLRRHGICYPDFGYRYSHIGIYRNGHFLISSYTDGNGQKFGDRPGNQYEEGLDKIAELAREFDKIILTDEAIWKGSKKRSDFWPRLKNDLEKRNLDLRIIVYLRRQDLWVQSFWSQKVKTGSGLDFHEFLSFLKEIDYPMDYYEYLNMLSGIFGKQTLIVRVYEKGQYLGKEKNLISDFLNIFGLSLEDGFLLNEKPCNITLTGIPLEIRRLINTLPYTRDQKKLLIQNIPKQKNTAAADNSTGHFSLFSLSEQQAYLEQFSSSNSRVAREYLGREDGILFYDPIEELPQPVINESDLLRDAIRLYAGAYLVQQETIKELKADIQKTKAAVRNLEEDVLWFRLKRKAHHLIHKNNEKKQ